MRRLNHWLTTAIENFKMSIRFGQLIRELGESPLTERVAVGDAQLENLAIKSLYEGIARKAQAQERVLQAIIDICMDKKASLNPENGRGTALDSIYLLAHRAKRVRASA